MKRIAAMICVLAIALLPVLPAAHAAGKYLVSAEDFMFYFNFYGALADDGHELSTENVFDFEYVSDGILYKTIFNECEILTLMLTSDAAQVKTIYCTWARNVKGSDKYAEDFLMMLTETLLACGMESDSISSLFTELGAGNSFEVGDKGEMTIDGIKVSYEVSLLTGISFTLERE